jgi:hypothetical protein
MIRKLLLVFIALFVSASVYAGEVSIDFFAGKVSVLEKIVERGAEADYVLTPMAEEICGEISEFTVIGNADKKYYTDLYWVRTVADSIKTESTMQKRRLAFANLIDTLNGLLLDLQTRTPQNGATRKQMHDALDRAMSTTREVRFADEAVTSKDLEWTGNGGYVIEGAGEGISMISASASGSGRSSGSGYSYSGSASGHSSGYSYSGSSYSGRSSSAGTTNYGNTANNSQSASSHYSSGSSGQSGSYSATSKGHNSRTSVHSGSSGQITQKPARARPTSAPPKVKQPKPVKPPKPPEPPRPPKKPTGLAGYIFWVIMAICVIGFLLMLYFIIRRTRHKIKQEQESIEKSENSLPPERMKNESIYELALKAAGQGDYAEGIRLLTIGALLLLEEQRVMNFQDNLTNGEYLRELLKERQLYSMFKEPMSLFDRLIYGFRSPGSPVFEKFKKFYLELAKVQN